MSTAGPDIVDVAIVGAGAAGLATAAFLGRAAPGRTIVALDGARKLGAKILVSGGGRCNLTNRRVSAADFCGGKRNTIKKILAAWPAERALAYFRDLGVAAHEEEHGKIFPDSNRARTVLEALVGEAQARGVRLLTERRVVGIEKLSEGFRLHTSGGEIVARRIVLATGGRSLPKTGSDGGGYELAAGLGHSLVPTTPALVPLVLDGDFHKPLSGVAVDVELSLRVAGAAPQRVSGALLWTHFGVSGPAVLDISRHWHAACRDGHPVELTASFLPGVDFAAGERRLVELVGLQPRTALHNALTGLLPARLADSILAALGISGSTPLAYLAREDRRRIVHALLEWPLPVRDSRGYVYAEVTAGGIPLEEIDPASMASRKCAGLYLVGEMLDVDGRIGGFNFQWAWAGARVAATGVQQGLRPA